VLPGSPNSGLRNQAFRGYADHMATAEFGEGVAELLELASVRTVAVLCAESLCTTSAPRAPCSIADHRRSWDAIHRMAPMVGTKQ